jgi:hypothetical protein
LKTPDWLRGWTYLTHIDRYFNTSNKQMLTRIAFDSALGRFLPADSLITPSFYALNRIKIPVFHMALYMPSEGSSFRMSGRDYVNAYSDQTAAPMPAILTDRDRENVERVKNHFRNMFSDTRDIRIFASWLASIIQTKRRPNWAVVLQGTEGDGKTFFAAMMAAILGSDNVYTLDAQTLESPYNNWAEGHLLTVVEEIRLVGHNRYNILNRIKPLITNDTIEIHPKNLNPYNVPNTSAYLAMTNHGNALPVTDNDRRYFILMSRWKDAEILNAFLADRPTYFDELFACIDESAGALRKWFQQYDLADEFQTTGAGSLQPRT